MQDKSQYIERLTQKFLPNDSYFIVKVEVTGNEGKEKVIVFIDGDEGIPIEVCSSISRQIASELETSEMFSGSYILEVSSPGVDFPLQSLRQYKKNIGRTLKVKTSDSSIYKGALLKVEDTGITLKIEKGKKTEELLQYIDYPKILKSNVIVTFK